MKQVSFLILSIVFLSCLTSYAQEQKPDISKAEWEYVKTLDKGDKLDSSCEVTGTMNGMRFQLKFEFGGEKYFSFVVIKDTRVITAHLFLQKPDGGRGNPVAGAQPEVQSHVKKIMQKFIQDDM